MTRAHPYSRERRKQRKRIASATAGDLSESQGTNGLFSTISRFLSNIWTPNDDKEDDAVAKDGARSSPRKATANTSSRKRFDRDEKFRLARQHVPKVRPYNQHQHRTSQTIRPSSSVLLRQATTTAAYNSSQQPSKQLWKDNVNIQPIQLPRSVGSQNWDANDTISILSMCRDAVRADPNVTFDQVVSRNGSRVVSREMSLDSIVAPAARDPHFFHDTNRKRKHYDAMSDHMSVDLESEFSASSSRAPSALMRRIVPKGARKPRRPIPVIQAVPKPLVDLKTVPEERKKQGGYFSADFDIDEGTTEPEPPKKVAASLTWSPIPSEKKSSLTPSTKEFEERVLKRRQDILEGKSNPPETFKIPPPAPATPAPSQPKPTETKPEQPKIPFTFGGPNSKPPKFEPSSEAGASGADKPAAEKPIFSANPSAGSSGFSFPAPKKAEESKPFSITSEASDKPPLFGGLTPSSQTQSKPALFTFSSATAPVSGEPQASKDEEQPSTGKKRPLGEESENAGQGEKTSSLFGAASDTKRPLFGGSTDKPVFGASAEKPSVGTATEKPLFGASTNKPLFGASTDKPLFGTSTDKPAFGASTDKPVFDASTDKPLFGASSDKPLFGASTDKPAFGISTDKPVFGASTDKPVFGTSTDKPVFGTSTDKPAAGSSVFGASTEKPTVGATDKPVFGKPAFGGSQDKPAENKTENKAPVFGSFTPPAGEQNKEPSTPSFSLGKSQASPFAFNSNQNATLTNGIAADAKKTDDKPAFTFGGTSGASTPKSEGPSFTFGANKAKTDGPTTAGGAFGGFGGSAAAGGFSFGGSNSGAATPVFGAGSTSMRNSAEPSPANPFGQSQVQNSSQPFGSSSTNGTFGFGSSGTTNPPVFGATTNAFASKSPSPAAFGSPNLGPTAANNGGFSFGANSPSTSNPAFGQPFGGMNSQQQQQQQQQQSQSNAPGGFGFGANSGFGGMAPANATGAFAMGAPSSQRKIAQPRSIRGRGSRR